MTSPPSEVEYVGQVKWFNDRLGYGFCTICSPGSEHGKDIFVHHSGICPSSSSYKTLTKGEYISFGMIDGRNGLQAINVTGVFGGPLMCDVYHNTRPAAHESSPGKHS